MQKKARSTAPAKTAHKAGKSSGAAGDSKTTAVAPQSKLTSKAAAPAKAPSHSTKAEAAPAKAPAKSGPDTTKKTKGPDRAGPAQAADTVAKSPDTKPAKEVSKTVVTKKAEAPAVKKEAAAPKAKARVDRVAFLAKQRELLLEERGSYISSAEALKAQADSLALEHEPGDVQFDEEGGEGGTANVDREIDLYLSAQARATVVEIDRALQKIEDGTYGICEQCGETIPDARLQALPYAALCVTCKSGGLSSRR
jgi:DnaK suppressor protein